MEAREIKKRRIDGIVATNSLTKKQICIEGVETVFHLVVTIAVSGLQEPIKEKTD